MKIIFKLSKPSNPSLNPTTHHQKLSFTSHSKPIISTTSVPTQDQISHLILEQKNATQALKTFRWASKIPNFTHSHSTYRALVHKLGVFRRFDTVHQVLEEMPISIGSPPDEGIFVTLVRGLGKAGLVKEAIKVLGLVSKFEKIPSLKIYNSILDVLVKEDIDIAREFYQRKMMECGVRGDEYTFGILMKGLCLTNRIDEGFKLLATMKLHGVIPNTVIYNTLLNGICKNEKVGRARSLMNEMAEPNEVTYNIMISTYCREENIVQALVMLGKSFDKGIVPDVVTVTKLIDVICNEGRINEAVEVLERVESKGGAIDAVAYNTLIKGFCKANKANLAVPFLKKMEIKGCLPNVDTYNTLIKGFCNSRNLDIALDMFNEMKRAGIRWNFVTFDTLIAGLCSEGRTKDGFALLELMEESKGGSEGRISVYNSIIYGLYKENRLNEAYKFLASMGKLFPRSVDRSLKILGFCENGNIEDAKRVFDIMTGEGDFPSALEYATLIDRNCENGQVKEAIELMSEMVGRGYFPVLSTCNGLLSGLCRQGNVLSALKLLEDIVERGFLPDIRSYYPLIDGFCRKGDFEKGFSLFLEMLDKGIVPDYSTWESLVVSLHKTKLWFGEKSMFPMGTDVFGIYTCN